MSTTKISYRYGKSLLELAQEQNVLDNVVSDVEMFRDSLESREFVNLLESPIVKADKKVKIFDAIFSGKLSDLTSRYFRLIIQKGREALLPQITQAFIDQYNKLKKVTTVDVTVAKEIGDDQLKEIKSRLAQSGKTEENIELNVKVNPDLLGGFILEFEGQKYDESVRTKLSDLKKNFSNN